MSWVLTGWATGAKSEQATRVQVKRPDYDINEEFGMAREATALYRRTYMDWPDETGHSAVSEEGEEKPGIPKAAPDVPDELEPPPVV